MLAAKPEPRKKAGDQAPSHVGRLTTAALEHRRVSMTYHSFHSRKVKSYVIEPYQIYYAQGGLYVFAVVPAYGEVRQFAIERIKTLRHDRRALRARSPRSMWRARPTRLA